jgi:hypothetical protein
MNKQVEQQNDIHRKQEIFIILVAANNYELVYMKEFMLKKHQVSHQNACPHIHATRLQPPFFSTGLWHLGQGLVFTVIQFTDSDSSRHFLIQRSHIMQEHGECACKEQLKQNWHPHVHSTSQ